MSDARHERLTFKCWNCKEGFSLLREIHIAPETWKQEVECPYCGARCVVDLTPFWGKYDHHYKGEVRVALTDFTPPDVIETTEPEE